MSLESTRINQELVNCYNSFKKTKSIYDELDKKHKEEIGFIKEKQLEVFNNIKKQLEKKIESLKSNPHFEKEATEKEKEEINNVLKEENDNEY